MVKGNEMYKIKTYNQIAQAGLDQFNQHYRIDDATTDPDAILLRSHSLHDTKIPHSIKAIARAGAGVNNIPVGDLTTRGIPVFNTPGANANAVKELVIAALLITARNLCRAISFVRSLSDDSAVEKIIEENKKHFVGHELTGKRLAVIGLGAIGVKVCNAAYDLGMNVIGYDPAITVERAWELSASIECADNIGQALMNADFISLHVPLTPETKGLINEETTNLFKQGVNLLNFSRGEIIDDAALLHALTHSVHHYVTDFPNHELLQHENVICFPHLGASTREAEENCAVMAAQTLSNFLETGQIKNSVNFPNVQMRPAAHGNRIAVVNKNIPNMLAQMSSVMAKFGFNITEMINKSRDEIAYTLIDFEGDIDPHLFHALNEIDGVIRVNEVI